MTEPHRWKTTLPNGETIRVTCRDEECADGEGGIGYRLEASTEPTAIDGVDAVLVGDGSDEASVRTARSDSDRSRLVALRGRASLYRTYVRFDGDRYPIHLPGPSLLRRCLDVTDGDTDAARNLVTEFSTPTRAVVLCSTFLTVPETAGLIDTLTHVNGYTESYLHSYRYDIVRGAIVSTSGLSVDSLAELKSLVDELDRIDGIGPVTLVDSLADAMATVHASADETKELLDDFGCELAEVERYSDDLFFACYLAQLVLTDGVRGAEGHAMRRRWNLSGDYKRRKARAKNANYSDRGRVWRELVCLSARRSLDEFAYVLANALYWSGEVSRSDSRIDELLLEAAAVVASDIGLDQIEGRARYELHLSRGHRLRSRKCYSPARKAFERAAAVAAEYEYLPEWEPVYAKATVHSAELGTAGNHRRAVTVLDDALERLLEYDLPARKLNHIVHHLEGQKLETRANLPNDSTESEETVSLLRDARTHYDVINLDRSRERIHRKLQRAKQSTTTEPDRASTTETSRAETPAERREESSASTEASASESTRESESRSPNVSDPRPAETRRGESAGTPASGRREVRTGGHVRSEHAQEEFESNPELDDFLAPPDPDEVGSADLMTSPEDRDDRSFADGESGWCGTGPDR